MTIVLIVDDSTFMRNHLKCILTKQNSITKFIECKNGLDAIRLYMKYKPHIVTMDFDMPRVDGTKAAKEILRYDKNAKIIMITAKEQKNMADNAMQYGIMAFIKKPLQEFEIKEAMEYVLAQSIQNAILRIK